MTNIIIMFALLIVCGIVTYVCYPGNLIVLRDDKDHVSHNIDDVNNLHSVDSGQQADPGF